MWVLGHSLIHLLIHLLVPLTHLFALNCFLCSPAHSLLSPMMWMPGFPTVLTHSAKEDDWLRKSMKIASKFLLWYFEVRKFMKNLSEKENPISRNLSKGIDHNGGQKKRLTSKLRMRRRRRRERWRNSLWKQFVRRLKKKCRGGKSDATSSSSLIASLFMMSFDNFCTQNGHIRFTKITRDKRTDGWTDGQTLL